MVNSIFGILFLHLLQYWVLFQAFPVKTYILALSLTDQLNKLFCKSNQFGANEGKCYGSLGKYLLHNVHAFNSRYLPTSTP